MISSTPAGRSFQGSLTPSIIVVYLALHALWGQAASGPYIFVELRLFFLIGIAAWLIWRGHASEIKGYFIGHLDASLSSRQIIFILASVIAGRIAVETLHPLPLSSTTNLWSDCVIAPFNEEIVFRGLFLAILLQQLTQAPGRAIALSTLVFAGVHDLRVRGSFDGGHLLALLVLGALLGWIYWKSGSVLFCIFCHVLWNIISFISLIPHR